MKKIMSCALGLALIFGVVSMPAQAASKKNSRGKHAKHAKHAKHSKSASKKTNA